MAFRGTPKGEQGWLIRHMQTHTEGEARSHARGCTHTHTGREKSEEREQSNTHPSGVVKANEGSVQGWHRQPFHVVTKRGGGGPGQAGEQ